MESLNIRPEDVPSSFLLCFHPDCPRRADCLRHVAGEPAGRVRDHGACVFPSALNSDGQCRFFRPVRTIRSAWGFRPLFDRVRHEDYALLRTQVMLLSGSRSRFFRYNRGDYRLTPEQQEQVLDIFRRQGYDTAEFHFEYYEDVIDFVGER